MVKINPDHHKMKHLEDLRKMIEDTQEEFKAKEDEKRKELEEISKKRNIELKKVEKKLEEAVALLSSAVTEEELGAEVPEEPNIETPQIVGEGPDLEQQIQQSSVDQRAGAMQSVYEIDRSDLESLPELYGTLREELRAGRANSPVVQQAKELIYHMNKKDVYMSQEARGLFRRDQVKDHYIDRMGALLDVMEERLGIEKVKNTYNA